MKKKKRWLVVASMILIIGMGVKFYMDKKEQEELRIIQTDLANYLYNNYQLYTFDKKEEELLDKEYNNGNGQMSYDEYSKKVDEIAIYSDIKKIEFTGFSITPMKNLIVYLTINNVYKEEVGLYTISAETNKFIYHIANSTGDGPYYIEEKANKTTVTMPKDDIIYYKGGIK